MGDENAFSNDYTINLLKIPLPLPQIYWKEFCGFILELYLDPCKRDKIDLEYFCCVCIPLL